MIERLFCWVETYVFPVLVTLLILLGIGGAVSPTLKRALQALLLG